MNEFLIYVFSSATPILLLVLFYEVKEGDLCANQGTTDAACSKFCSDSK